MDDPFTMVVLIVLISVGAGVINNYLKLRNKGAGNNKELLEGLDALRTDVDRLSKRVASLEKIATDPEKSLAKEIDSLR